MIILSAIQLAIALLAIACGRQTTATRNYHPMLRVLWTAIAFVFGGSAVNTALGGTPHQTTRWVFAVAMFLAVGYSLWFIRKRNHTPRFVGITLAGELHLVPVADLERAATLTDSWAHHGAMPPETVARLEESLREWHRMEEWRAGLTAQVARRRAERDEPARGIPDD